MTKKEARSILENDFKNKLISMGYSKIEQIDNESDREICKALKIKLTN